MLSKNNKKTLVATNTTTAAGENQSISAVEGISDAGEQSNMTTPQNKITDGNTTQAGTIGSGGAGGAESSSTN